MPLNMFSSNKPSVKAVIGIAAGKGGVGKSTVTVNLALALHAKGYRVGVMDTDIYGPSVRRMLPEDELPSQQGQMITPAICSGIKMISMAYFRKTGEATVVRAPIANSLITQFIKNIEWGDLDFLLIDFPPGTGDVQLTLSQQANLTGAVMVTTPQEVAVMDVRKAMHLFEQVKIPILGIVENMSYYQPAPTSEPVYLFGRGGGKRLSNESGVPFLGEIPIDPDLCTCGDQGISLFEMDKGHQKAVTQSFLQLADEVINHTQTLMEKSKDSLQQFELIWREI